jgi:intracellular septation protein
MLQLTAEGWRKLTLRWALFFLAMAVLNEAVWRTQSTDFWVNFKLFGFVPLTLLFAASQFPLMTRHAVEDPASAESSSGS